MRVVGLLATGLVAVGVVVSAVVGVRSISDVKRYLRMRNM